MFPLAQAMNLPPASTIISIAIVVFLSIGLHEYAHAKLADMAGDPTPRYYGRVTLNLTKHFELLGTIMMIFTSLTGYGIGWGKPVPMDPRKMRNPRWDHLVAVAGGPITNLLLAAVFAILVRLYLMMPAASVSPVVLEFLFLGVLVNVSLFSFNLIPMGPLDGMWVVSTFLPDPARMNWIRFNLGFGSILFLMIVIFGQMGNFSILSMVLDPVRDFLTRILLGTKL